MRTENGGKYIKNNIPLRGYVVDILVEMKRPRIKNRKKKRSRFK